MTAIPTEVRGAIACPTCHGSLEWLQGSARCRSCSIDYPTGAAIDFRPASHRGKTEFRDWTDHWSNKNQHSFSQRFFSVYRRAVFARTVEWHVDRFFPEIGVFVEAGSGTSETSERIDKRGGARKLVAVDLVLEVVANAHAIMDTRVAADCFHLPFADKSIDGLWNVGVMEHFTHDLIDQMMREFHRVLKPGTAIILLWPATDSLPQKALRFVEFIVNNTSRRSGKAPLQFHPPEISKLTSSEEGRHVMRRNGFEPVFVDWGLRSLMAFKTVVGRRN